MEIVYRALIVFFFLWIITRVVGRSTIGELSTFQLVLFVTMGDMVQQAVMQQDNSLIGGVVAISVFAVLTIAISWVTLRWPRLRWLTHGVPVLIVKDGVPIDQALRRERITSDDLHAAARQQGFERLTDIRMAVLEANGAISFFARDPAEDDRAGAEDKPAIA